MTRVLIADQIKSSLVMTSEVFKDKLPGCIVNIARSGAECLEVLEKEKPDMIIIDFDLADTDGITLSQMLRKIYDGPILLTAFPDKTVSAAVESELFAYSDVSDWLAKPFKFEQLAEKIDHFLLKRSRLFKRFDTDLETLLVGKGAGRGKRSPKVSGNIITLSVKGALVKLESTMKMKIGDEITVSVDLPDGEVAKSSSAGKKTTGKTSSKSKSLVIKTKAAKLKAKITWTNKGKTEAGIQFNKLSEPQKRMLEVVMREPGEE